MAEIIELTEADLDSVTALDERIFPESPWGKESFRANIRNDFDHPLTAVEDGKVVGFGILRQIDAGEILLVGVDPRERRKGIGEKLVKELLALSRQGEHVFLEVRSQNAAAVGLYRKTGFTEIARRKNYYQTPADDAIIMMV